MENPSVGEGIATVSKAPKVVPPDGPAPSAVRRGHGLAGSVALQAGVVLAGAVVALLRVAGVPAWDSGYSDDVHIFLINALAQPWHLLMPYGGYEELLPRLLAMEVRMAARNPSPCAVASSRMISTMELSFVTDVVRSFRWSAGERSFTCHRSIAPR